jgi:hypothetical protein
LVRFHRVTAPRIFLPCAVSAGNRTSNNLAL